MPSFPRYRKVPIHNALVLIWALCTRGVIAFVFVCVCVCVFVRVSPDKPFAGPPVSFAQDLSTLVCEQCSGMVPFMGWGSSYRLYHGFRCPYSPVSPSNTPAKQHTQPSSAGCQPAPTIVSKRYNSYASSYRQSYHICHQEIANAQVLHHQLLPTMAAGKCFLEGGF